MEVAIWLGELKLCRKKHQRDELNVHDLHKQVTYLSYC